MWLIFVLVIVGIVFSFQRKLIPKKPANADPRTISRAWLRGHFGFPGGSVSSAAKPVYKQLFFHFTRHNHAAANHSKPH